MPFSQSTRRWLALAAIVGYWVLLCVFTHLPGHPNPETHGRQIPHLDKLVHAAAFAGLAFLAGVAVAAFRAVTLPALATIAAGLVLYAAIDELTQGWVRLRVPDYRDWLADVLGIVAGCVCFWAMRWWLSRCVADTVPATAAK